MRKYLFYMRSHFHVLRLPESSEKNVSTKVSISTKIVKIGAFFEFLKKILWKNQNFQYWFLIVLINLYTVKKMLLNQKHFFQKHVYYEYIKIYYKNQ